jgi:ATP synthase F1 gamma subunit
MATLRELRSRINTVKNIAKITQAMKLVAAARLNKAQQRVQAARPYAEMMQQVMQQLSTAAGELSHPLLEVREERNIAAIIMTSDRGLCGSYNTNLVRKAMELLRPRDPATVRLVLMGRKGAAFFRRQRYPVEQQLPLNANNASFADVVPAVQRVRELFESGQVDAVYLVYSRFVNPMTQTPTILQLLPLQPEAVTAAPAAATPPSPSRGGAGGGVPCGERIILQQRAERDGAEAQAGLAEEGAPRNSAGMGEFWVHECLRSYNTTTAALQEHLDR